MLNRAAQIIMLVKPCPDILFLVAAVGLTRVMSSLLYGVVAIDPVTFGVVAAVLLAVALVASYLPARRAARTDPLKALRFE